VGRMCRVGVELDDTADVVVTNERVTVQFGERRGEHRPHELPDGGAERAVSCGLQDAISRRPDLRHVPGRTGPATRRFLTMTLRTGSAPRVRATHERAMGVPRGTPPPHAEWTRAVDPSA
jgi:hypothetical protein